MKKKIIILTLACAIPAFFLGRIIWPDSADIPTVSGVQMALLALVFASEALAFGLAVSFVVFGRPLLKKFPSPFPRHREWAFWSIAWTLGSWWPHDNMHRSNALENVWGLIKIEYLFHLTLLVCAAIIAYYFIRTLKHPN